MTNPRFKKSLSTKRLVRVLILPFLLFASHAATAWNWKLPDARYKQLNMFERAQYDKAKRLFESKQYRAAAGEFEKFKIQFGRSPLLPYVIFMRGYALHQAKDRNAAIKVYNEVLDFFGEEVQDAAPALYFLGQAHLDNGDEKKGLEAMKEMVEDVDYRQHPLAAGALNRLAQNHWRNNEPEQAVKYWKRAYAEFGDTNTHDVRTARDNAIAYYVRTRQYDQIEDFLGAAEGDDDHRHWIVKHIWHEAFLGLRTRHGWPEFRHAKLGDRNTMLEGFWDYFKTRKPWFAAAGDDWGYYNRALRIVCERYNNRDARQAMIENTLSFVKQKEKAGPPEEKSEAEHQEAVWKWYADMVNIVVRSYAGPQEVRNLIDETTTFVASMKTPDKDGKFSYMIDKLRSAGLTDQARYLTQKLKDRALAAWHEYRLLAAENKWQEAEKKLIDIEKMGDAEWTSKAENSRAWVYKERLHDYDKAIKLYRQIANPPETLWHIQECYRRWGKLDSAITALSEIENSFPDDAAKAAWRKAELYKSVGENKKAIAVARRILKVYPKSGESSKAHQLLENYGIATGGGLTDSEL